MKKHTRRINEISFAERLELGDVFAISDTTFMPTIQSTLKTQKDLYATRVPFRELTQSQKRHWDVYRVVPDRDPTPIVDRRRFRQEALASRTYSPYLLRDEAFLINHEEQWDIDWQKRHGEKKS